MAAAVATVTCAMLGMLPSSSIVIQRSPTRAAKVILCDKQEVPPPPDAPAVPPPPKPKTFSADWSGAGRFADEDPLPLSFWLLGPKPRRGILTSLAIWGVIAPAANLWGTGSFLLSLAPDAARGAKLDTFYPVSTNRFYPYAKGYLNYDVGGFKRYVDDANRFEFRYPSKYLQDQAVFMRNQDMAYTRRMMDPTLANTPSNVPPSRRSQQGVAVAFGPAGEGQGAVENLSVVVGKLDPGFTLRGTLGTPTEGAERLLQATIAKQKIVEQTTLLNAFERRSARSNLPLYQFEYRVDYVSDMPQGPQPPSYTTCVVGASKDTLYTFASRVPQAVWEENAASLREAAASFELNG